MMFPTSLSRWHYVLGMIGSGSIVTQSMLYSSSYIFLARSNEAASGVCVMVNGVLKLLVSSCIASTIRSNALLNVVFGRGMW